MKLERLPYTALAMTFLSAPFAIAQTECAAQGGPDMIMGDITGPTNYTGTADFDAFALGHYQCNIGATWVEWFEGNRRHPVFGFNLFKMSTIGGATRIEQLGQSWIMHAFFALSNPLCCTDCQPTDGTHLGVHCANPDSSSRTGSQAQLGPKWQVNAATGVFAYPPANPSWSGPVARRLQVHVRDLEPSSASVLYFAEAQNIVPDEPRDATRFNNASYRRTNMTGSGSAWTLSFAAPTQREKAGIRAWHDNDPAVTEKDVVVPDDGLFIVAARATHLANGLWHYEYAIQNLNSDRSAQAFSLAMSACVSVYGIGFHDVDYHDGDGPGNVNFDGADWPAAIENGAITWSTQTFDQNQSANALRWGTLYNFRFDADAPPLPGGDNATITFFKPGTPTAMTTGPIPVPGNRTGDLDGDGNVDLDDLSALLAHFGSTAGATAADGDSDADGDVDLNDLATLLSAFGAFCP